MAWGDLEKKPATKAEREEAQRVDRLFARVFSTPDGLEVLALLRARTIERGMDPDAPHSALAYMEGQRQVVRAIEQRVANGREQHPSELRREYPSLRRDRPADQ